MSYVRVKIELRGAVTVCHTLFLLASLSPPPFLPISLSHSLTHFLFVCLRTLMFLQTKFYSGFRFATGCSCEKRVFLDDELL